MAENKPSRFYHLWPFIKKYRSYFIFGFGATFFANGLVLIIPYLVKLVFDGISSGKPNSYVLNLCLFMIGLALVGGIFRFLMRRTIIWASRKIEFDFRNLLFEKLLSLDPSYYNRTKTGDLMAHATNDMDAVRMMVGPGIMHIANTIVSTAIAISFMAALSVKLTLITLIPLVLLSLTVNKLGGLVHQRFLKIQEHFSYLTSRVQENLAGVRVIKAYRKEDSEIERFSGISRQYVDMNLGMMRIVGLFYPLLYMIAGSVGLVVLYFGGRQINAGSITLGTFVAFFGYLGWLIWPMIALGWVISLYQRGKASLERINKILNTRPNIIPPARPAATEDETKGKIEFRDLTFTYPPNRDGGASGEAVLHTINMVIEPGTRLGITGPTGSGKTTLVSLIPRLYPVESGRLFIDDIDINLWPLDRLRDSIGFVPQETFLFSDTIEANITFSSDHIVHQEVEEATRLAALHGDIESFPARYETILGERGITLSGGQKQRATLARAIFRKPPILILDDATSSVDTETEEAIFSNLNKVLPGRTSIIISHRVSSLKDCNRIVYMEDGTIVEDGSHKELMRKGGAYANLYRQQLMEEQLAKM
jgi:ATP-binding cassette subfamily B multidrug efflux pump